MMSLTRASWTPAPTQRRILCSQAAQPPLPAPPCGPADSADLLEWVLKSHRRPSRRRRRRRRPCRRRSSCFRLRWLGRPHTRRPIRRRSRRRRRGLPASCPAWCLPGHPGLRLCTAAIATLRANQLTGAYTYPCYNLQIKLEPSPGHQLSDKKSAERTSDSTNAHESFETSFTMHYNCMVHCAEMQGMLCLSA